jgi:tetratricopeptide (TPR) repeat protein
VNKQPIAVSVQSTDEPGLRKLLAQDPSIPASCRTRIVLARALLAQHAPSQELVEAAGNNFCGPDPLFYWDLAAELNERGEYLGEALQYATWSARRHANDAIGQLNPALLIASIQIKRGELDLVISSLSKSREADSGAFAWLGLAYEKTNQVDRAIEAYIQSVGAQEIWSTIPPQGERRSMRLPEFNLEEMYRKRYGSLEGLAARIKTARRAAFRVLYVDPFRIKNPTFQWMLYDLNSGYVSLANYLGRIVVLCFVPTEYEPVLQELKHLQTLSEEYKDGEVVFLVVDVHLEKFPSATRRQDVAEALIKAGITLPATMEVFDTVRKCYMMTGVGGPTSGVVIIDSTHRQAFLTGGISQEYVPRITKILDYLLQEPLS